MNPSDIKEGDVFIDRDKRMNGRRLKVVSILRPPNGHGGAYLAQIDSYGRNLPGRKALIRLDRLATSFLFTKE